MAGAPAPARKGGADRPANSLAGVPALAGEGGRTDGLPAAWMAPRARRSLRLHAMDGAPARTGWRLAMAIRTRLRTQLRIACGHGDEREGDSS
jgi:hypothetical protein